MAKQQKLSRPVVKAVTLLGPSELNESAPLSFQPAATTALCLNYRNHEPSTDRDRGGMRGGLTKLTTARIGPAAVQDLLHILVTLDVS